MPEKNEIRQINARGLFRKRYKVLEGSSPSHFNLAQPLNLSEKEYERWKEERKKMANAG